MAWLRWAALVGWFVVPTAALVVFFHTGARAADLCGDQGSVSGGLSLVPPGARCAGGEPAVERIEFDLALLAAVVVFVWPLQALMVWAGAERWARRSRRLPDPAGH